jgi:nickel-dependent lactate racemase
MEIKLQYGDGWINVDLPAKPTVVRYNTEIFPGINYSSNPLELIRKAIDNPIGGESLEDIVERGVKKVSISFDDPTRPPSVKISLKAVIDKLNSLGIRDRDIVLISANGAHNKWTRTELRNHVGDEIFYRFWPPESTVTRIFNHDCTQDLVYLGETEFGDMVEYNKILVETDLHIHCGNITSIAYGGFSGQGIVVGLMGIKTANSHHGAHIFMHPDACHSDPSPEKNIFRKHKLAFHRKIEEHTKNRIFYVDCISTMDGIIEAFAGYVPELEKLEYPAAEKHFRVKVPQADILVIGTPSRITYDSLDNPLILAAYLLYPLRLARKKPLVKKEGVIIAPVKCRGIFSEKRPGDEEAFRLLGDYIDVEELWFDNIDYFWNNSEYLFKYRYRYAYAPWHCLWGATNPLVLQNFVREVLIFGDIKPGVIRQIGCKPVKSWDDAWNQAVEIVGPDPAVTVLPAFWSEPKPVFDVY